MTSQTSNFTEQAVEIEKRREGKKRRGKTSRGRWREVGILFRMARVF